VKKGTEEMLATMTSKGQVTLPKEIRDKLELDAGSKLDFTLQEDGTLTMRPLKRSALSIIGMLKRPGQKAATVTEMNKGIARYLTDKHPRRKKK